MSKFTTRITKVKKNNNGVITDVMMDNGNVYTMDEAVNMAKHHVIEGVKITQARNGNDYLISSPNGDEDYKLDKLPKF
jgi:hypothetical protein